MKLQYESELYHFGIKGMHWGIRRFQNKDGTLTEAGKKRVKRQGTDEFTGIVAASKDDLQEEIGRSDNIISKGTSVYRSGGSGEKLTNRRTYVSVLDNDRAEYRSAANEGKLGYDNPLDITPTEYEFKAKKDLRVVSPQQQYDYIYEKFGDLTVHDLFTKTPVKAAKAFTPNTEAGRKVFQDFLKRYGDTKMSTLKGDMDFLYENDRDFRIMYGYSYSSNSSKERKKIGAYADAMSTIEKRFLASTLFMPSKANNDALLSDKHYEMQEHFKKQGYQALVDLEDWGYTYYPLIVMDPKDNLKKVKETKI
jgi:hypothetical protein